MRPFGTTGLRSSRHNLSFMEKQDDQEDVMSVKAPPRASTKPKQMVFEKKHSPQQQVNASISASTYEYLLSGVGTAGGNYGAISFQSLPAAQKRILQTSFASYTLTNYVNTDFPAALYIVCAQLDGMIGQQGASTHIVAVMLPTGPSVPVYNAGGIIGYNQTYSLKATEKQYDVTNINELTFDISIDQSGQPVAYPLSQTLVCGLRVSAATF